MLRISIILLSIWMIGFAQAAAEGENFGVRGQLATNYNDNITFAHTNVFADLIETTLVGLDLKKQWQRNNFLAQIDLAHDFYFRNKSFDNTIVVFRALDLYELSDRMRFNLSENYERAQEPRSFDDAFGRNSGRYRTDRNKLKLQYELDLSSHASIEVTYGNEFTGYSRADLDNTVLNQPGTRFQYAFNEVDRVGLGYTFSLRDFESGSQIQGNSVIVDFGHNFTKQLQVVMKAGEDFISEDTIGSSHNVRYELSLLNDIDQATHAGLRYQRGLNSYAYSHDLFDSYQISANFARELTQRISLSGAGFYGQGDYQQSRVHDELLGAATQVNYALSEHSQIGLTYNYAKTISNQDSRSYQRNFVGIQLQLKY